MNVRNVLFTALLAPALAFAQSGSAGTTGTTPSGTTPPSRTGTTGTMGSPSDTPSRGGTMANPHAGHGHAAGSTTAGTMTDTELLTKLQHVNQMEIDLGKLAQKNAASKQVKTYGQKLVKDHTKAAQDLQAYAKKNNVTLPTTASAATGTTGTTPTTGTTGTTTGATGTTGTTGTTATGTTGTTGSMAAAPEAQKHAESMAKLQTLTGTEFDNQFLTMMVQGHQDAVSMVETASQTNPNPELKKILTKLLPQLKQHRQEAEKLQANLSGKPAGSR